MSKPIIGSPKKKDLPTLGCQTIEVRAKIKEEAQKNDRLEARSVEIHSNMTQEGKRDQVNLREPKAAPDLQFGA